MFGVMAYCVGRYLLKVVHPTVALVIQRPAKKLIQVNICRVYYLIFFIGSCNSAMYKHVFNDNKNYFQLYY